MEATFIRKLDDWLSDARLYQLSEPRSFTSLQWDRDASDDLFEAIAEGVEVTQDYEYIVVSAVTVPYTGEETLVFPCLSDGSVLDWTEVAGFRGALDHERAIREFVNAPLELE